MTKKARNSLNMLTAVNFIADSPGPVMYHGDPTAGSSTVMHRNIKHIVEIIIRMIKYAIRYRLAVLVKRNQNIKIRTSLNNIVDQAYFSIVENLFDVNLEFKANFVSCPV